MPEKMPRQVKQKSRTPLPAKTDISELEVLVGQQNLARHIPGNLTSHDVLQLHRVIGNRAVGQLLGRSDKYATKSPAIHRSLVNNSITTNFHAETIQRDEYDDPDDFITWFRKEDVYTKSLSNRGGDCAPSAKAISAFLSKKFAGRDGVTVGYRGISFLSPYGHPAANNVPHFVVTVTWAGRTVVIDPTQEQFKGGKNQVADNGTWEAGFGSLPTTFMTPDFVPVQAITPKVYADFDTFDKANQFISDNVYKTSVNDKPVGTEIGAWVNERVPYVKPAKSSSSVTPAKKKKKGFFSSLFG